MRIYNKTDIGSDSFLLTKADINKLPEKGQIISILSFVDQRVTATQNNSVILTQKSYRQYTHKKVWPCSDSLLFIDARV